MTLVENLQTWKDAVECYNEGDFQSSLDKFREIKDSTAKIIFNIGRAYLSLCDLQAAFQVGIYIIISSRRIVFKLGNRLCINIKPIFIIIGN